MSFRVLALFVLIAPFAGTSASAQDLTGADLRREVERHAVVVSVEWPEVGEKVVGSGLVVAAKGDSLYVLTARHTLFKSEYQGLERVVQLQFLGTPESIETSMDPVDLGVELDAALVPIQRDRVPLETHSLFDSLRFSVAAERAVGERVHVLGYDRKLDKLDWKEGSLRELGSDRISLDADGVGLGYSGGVVVSSAYGLLGMFVASGSGGLRHRAAPVDEIAEVAQRKGVSFSIRSNRVLAALSAALESEMPLTLVVWEDRTNRWVNDWFEIRLDEKDGNVFKGTLIPLQGKEHPVTVESTVSGLSINMPRALNKFDLPKLRSFLGTESVALRDFQVVRCDAGTMVAHLAIPFTSRVLAGRMLFDECRRGIQKSNKSLLLRGKLPAVRLAKSDGVEPFAFSVNVIKDPVHWVAFPIPEVIRARGGQIQGRIGVTDNLTSIGREQNRIRLFESEVQFQDAHTGAVLGRVGLDDELGGVEFDIEIPSGTRKLRIGLDRTYGQVQILMVDVTLAAST